MTALVAAGIGFAAGSQLFPKVEQKTVEVEKEVIRKDVKTVIKEVVRPDGTKETETTIVDKSKENRKNTEISTTYAKNDWHVSVSVSHNPIIVKSESDFIYGLQVERRIIGDFYAGIRADSNKTIGVSAGMSF